MIVKFVFAIVKACPFAPGLLPGRFWREMFFGGITPIFRGRDGARSAVQRTSVPVLVGHGLPPLACRVSIRGYALHELGAEKKQGTRAEWSVACDAWKSRSLRYFQVSRAEGCRVSTRECNGHTDHLDEAAHHPRGGAAVANRSGASATFLPARTAAPPVMTLPADADKLADPPAITLHTVAVAPPACIAANKPSAGTAPACRADCTKAAMVQAPTPSVPNPVAQASGARKKAVRLFCKSLEGEPSWK